MKQLIFQIGKFFDIHAKQGVDDFIKEKIEKCDFVITSTEMNKEHICFGGDLKIFLYSIIYKFRIIILQNTSKSLILGTHTEKLYSIFELGDPPARVHLFCHLVLLYYYCPRKPSYQNEFNRYMYLAVEDNKHWMSDEWNPYYYEKESGSAVQPKGKDVEKVGTVSEEGTLIKSTVEKVIEITKDNAKTTQDEKDVLMDVPNAATEKELKKL